MAGEGRELDHVDSVERVAVMRVEVRVGSVTGEVVFATLWHSQGERGEVTLDRGALEAIAGPLDVREGDYLAFEVKPLGRSRWGE
jgi:hypothetical protein